MSRIILHADLDNTIIYSYKHDIGSKKRNVELYEGREVSFVTERTYQLLRQVKEGMLIVPTSTRTIQQYERIHLGIGNLRYALVCNGGILLVDGVSQKDWYEASLKLIGDSREEVQKARRLLETDSRRSFELRYIEELFLFTKCRDAAAVVGELRDALDGAVVDVFQNGEKVYVVPKNLSKGKAVQRFREFIGGGFVIAAGDSEFDISMLEEADAAFAPWGFGEKYHARTGAVEAGEDVLLAEFALGECRRMVVEMGI